MNDECQLTQDCEDQACPCLGNLFLDLHLENLKTKIKCWSLVTIINAFINRLMKSSQGVTSSI